jgi:hypothetical protein
LIGLGPSRISTSIEGLFWKVVNNDFNGISWADRVTVAAHIAFGVVDYKLFVMFINCLERAPIQAFSAGNAFFSNANTSERDVLSAKTKIGTQ